jgi:anti-sigma B factor antagonist
MAVDAQPELGARRVVVALPAEIDLDNADQIGRQLGAALAPGVAMVIADMTATSFCDTSGVRMLVLAHKGAAACHAELRVVIPSANVLGVLAIMKVDRVLRIYPSLEDALASRGLETAFLSYGWACDGLTGDLTRSGMRSGTRGLSGVLAVWWRCLRAGPDASS